MRTLASLLNEIGRFFERRGRHQVAANMYAAATRISPTWAVPWFNQGLMAKFGHRWQECFSLTARATELDPDFKPAWWNLGIAATAIGNWAMARQSWTSYGIDVPPGEGPLEMNLGAIPIRINPAGTAEVVWCERIDPARARIASIPFPDSGRACGDLLLTDGEPRGHRDFHGRQLPVFNELDVLATSGFSTYSAAILAIDEKAVYSLLSIAAERAARAEDWSTVHILCGACSEGVVCSHHSTNPPAEWNPRRVIGIAANDVATVDGLLEEWVAAGDSRSVLSVECVFKRQPQTREKA